MRVKAKQTKKTVFVELKFKKLLQLLSKKGSVKLKFFKKEKSIKILIDKIDKEHNPHYVLSVEADGIKTRELQKAAAFIAIKRILKIKTGLSVVIEKK